MCEDIDSNRSRTVVLYRPVGDEELSLIQASEWKSFPPRLPEQPIFYPVLGEDYAAQIAEQWNTKNGRNGYVLRFRVEREYIAKFVIHTVGSRIHREYWIPAEELHEFNRHIVGPIEIVRRFSGS